MTPGPLRAVPDTERVLDWFVPLCGVALVLLVLVLLIGLEALTRM